MRAMWTLALLAPAVAGQDGPIVESVFLRDSDVHAVYQTGEAKRLTADGRRKRLVTVSPDGSRVAFLEDSPRRALAALVTLSADGTRLCERDFRPFHSTGMLQIDELSWLGTDRLALSGSVNATAAEYAVVDARTGDELHAYFVDGSAWAPSPDGAHVAYLDYVPLAGREIHPLGGRYRRLCVDEECRFDGSGGFPARGRRLDFEWPPAWSADGRLAIVAQDLDRRPKRVVIVKHVSGAWQEIAAPGDPADPVGLAWVGSELRARSGELLWKLVRSTFVPAHN